MAFLVKQIEFHVTAKIWQNCTYCESKNIYIQQIGRRTHNRTEIIRHTFGIS